MLEGCLAEGQQPHLYPRRIAARLMRHVGPADKRCGPDGSKHVLDHGPMQHLLRGDTQDHLAPLLDGRDLVGPEPGTRAAFEAERGVEVLAHQAVL
jgi:hypothetical protein